MTEQTTTDPHGAEMGAITGCKRWIEPLSYAARQRVLMWLADWAREEHAADPLVRDAGVNGLAASQSGWGGRAVPF